MDHLTQYKYWVRQTTALLDHGKNYDLLKLGFLVKIKLV